MTPKDWGEVSSDYKDRTTHMKKQFVNNPYTKKDPLGLKKEYDDHFESLETIGPAAKGSMFLVPTKELLVDKNHEEWFLLDDTWLYHLPLSLPFNKAIYINEVKYAREQRELAKVQEKKVEIYDQDTHNKKTTPSAIDDP